MTKHHRARWRLASTWLLLPLVAVTTASCGDPSGTATDLTASICPVGTRAGGFVAALEDGYTTLQGAVADGVSVEVPALVVMEEAGCQLVRSEARFCSPPCAASEACGLGGVCVSRPRNVDIGAVTVSGLASPATMVARPPTLFYSFSGELLHPGFTLETVAELTTAHPTFPLQLRARGVAPLVMTTTTMPLTPGKISTVSWTSDGPGAGVGIELELNIANHGGTPGSLVCHVDDTGTFSFPQALTDALLSEPYSGFPSLRVARLGAGSTETAAGCVDFRLQSETVLPVDIEGLVSCSSDVDCPDAQRCQADLRCATPPGAR